MILIERDTKIEKVAKAIAWTTLTDKGRKECKWPNDFAPTEIAQFRVMAAAAIEAMK